MALSIEIKPPHNQTLEKTIISAFLASPSTFDEVSPLIEPDDFYLPLCAEMFKACRKVREAGAEPDLVAVTSRMERDGTLAAVGGMSAVGEVCSTIPVITNIGHYVGELKDLSNKRKLAMIAAGMAKRLSGSESSTGIIESSVEQMLGIPAPAGEDDCCGEFGGLARKLIDKARKDGGERREKQGIPSGLACLDKYLRPMRPGQLITIGARTSVGKTALALQIAGNAAMMGKKVMFCTLEMDAEECAARVLAQLTGVATTNIEDGNIPPEASDVISDILSREETANLWLDGYRRLSPSALASRATKRARTVGLDLLIVDYLQLMVTSGKSESRVQEVSQITRNLKILAGDLRVPIICVSQLNRAAEYGRDEQDQLPKLIHLRESGSIEQDSNTVILIHRNMDFVGYGAEYSARLILAKQRGGVAGVTLRARWCPVTQTFSDDINPEEIRA